MSDKLSSPLSVPVLDTLPHGKYSLGVPIANGSIPLGSSVKPTSFDRLLVEVAQGTVTLSRKSGAPIQIESGTVVQNSDGSRRVVRGPVLTSPTVALVLRNTGDGWESDAELVNPDRRVGLVRLAAKVGAGVVANSKSPQQAIKT